MLICRLLFFSLVLFLVSCNGRLNYEDFDINVNGGHRFITQIPIDVFLEELLKGYTDPDLRLIIKKCGDPNQVDARTFFSSIIIVSKESNYDLPRYFNRANPLLFKEGLSIEEIKIIMNEEYNRASETMLFQVNELLIKEELKHNISESENNQLVIEVQNEKDAERVREIINITANPLLYFYEPVALGEVLDSLVKMDNLITKDSSAYTDPLFLSPLFSGILELPFTTEFTLGSPISLVDKNSSIIGRSNLEDTAKVIKIINQCKTLLPWDIDWGWQTEYGLLQKKTGRFLLYFLRLPEEELQIKRRDIFSALLVNYKDGKDFGVQLVFEIEGRMKWYDLANRNIGKIIVIGIDGEIISAPVIEEGIGLQICEIRQCMTMDEASKLADQIIFSCAMPFPLCIFEEKDIPTSL